MRLIKYLVFIFLSIVSVNAFAAIKYYFGSYSASTALYNTPQAACTAASSTYQFFPTSNPPTIGYQGECMHPTQGGGSGIYSKEVADTTCPSQNEMAGMQVTWFDYNTPIPTRTCTELSPGKYCIYESKSDKPVVINYPQRQMVTLWSKSTTPALSCTPAFDGVCDKNDPYGKCYTPPNDGCTRQQDGSIVCPDNQSPPIQQGCENGATYCNRPAGGCGSNYVSGSFNGQQICVRKSNDAPPNPNPTQPNDPNHPEDPNRCTATSCPKPDPTKDCPVGYYETSHNGQAICVQNNPNPNQPNPNDPNNSGGDGGNDGGSGESGSINLKPILDAIKALKDALLSALDSISKKITSLIDGQKTTNEHLKNIKDESVKTNEKLDTSNDHLKKIEEATGAASEALGTANKHLEKIEEATAAASETLGDMRDFLKEEPASGLLADTPLEIKEEQVTDYQREDHIRFGQYCPFTPSVQHIGYFTVENDSTWICTFGHQARPYIQALGYLGALIFLMIGLRSKD